MSTKAGDKIKVYKVFCEEIIIMVSQGSMLRHEVCGNYMSGCTEGTQNSRLQVLKRGWPFFTFVAVEVRE